MVFKGSVGSDLQRYCKSAYPCKILNFLYSTIGHYCVKKIPSLSPLLGLKKGCMANLWACYLKYGLEAFYAVAYVAVPPRSSMRTPGRTESHTRGTPKHSTA